MPESGGLRTIQLAVSDEQSWRVSTLATIPLSMPTVLRFGPYRFYFFSHEPNERPHVHVARESMRTKFWLDPISLAMNSGFGPRELHTIERIVENHMKELLESWYGYFGAGSG